MKNSDLSRSVESLFERWPGTVQLFLQHQMACPGCYLAGFESLEGALQVYQVERERFLDDLKQIISNSERETCRTQRKMTVTEEQIRATLKNVLDPEIGVNIVDLGLIYSIEIKPEEVYIQLTMTSPACPLHGVITRNMDQVLRQQYPDLGEMTIEVVWEPPWKPERMSDTAKEQLGW